MEDVKIGGVDTSAAQTSLKALRETLKAAKDEMLSAGEGTKQYADALKKAADAQFTMREMNEQIRASAMDLGAVLQNSTKVIQGLAGGYTAFQGITQLMGLENKDLEQTFVKLQAAMAVVQGLDGIDGMFKGLKNLNTIISPLSTSIKNVTGVQKVWNYVTSLSPIFLLVTGVVALGTAIYGLTTMISSNNKEQEEANRLLNDYNSISEEATRQADLRIKLMGIQGKTEKEINDQRVKDNNEEFGRISDEISRLQQKEDLNEKEEEQLKNLQDARTKNLEEYKRLQDEYVLIDARTSEKKKKSDDEKIKKQEETNKKLNEEEKKSKEEREKLVADQITKDLENIDKINENVRTRGLTKLQILEEQYLKEKQLLEEYQKSTYSLTKLYEADKKKIEDENRLEDATKAEEHRQRQLESQQRFTENQRSIYENAYLMKDELDRSAYLNGQTTEYEYQQSILQNQIDYNAKQLEDTSLTELERTQIENDMAEARKMIREIEYQDKMNKLSATSNMLDQASSLLGKQTAEGKALAVAAATINTYVSAADSYRTGAKIGGPVVGGIFAAVAVAAGLKTVQSILKVKVPKSGGSGGGSTPSIPTISAPKLPGTIQAVRNVQTQSEVELQKQPVKAYVVESEITSTQDRVNNIKKEAEF